MKITRVALIAILAVGVCGCAGSKRYSESWASYGSLQMVEPDNPDHDYKFYVKPLVDFGVNASVPADRAMLIRAYLEEQCRDIRVVDDQFLPSGGAYLTGVKKGVYIVRVKCLKDG